VKDPEFVYGGNEGYAGRDTISESGIRENRMYRLIERTEEGGSRPLTTLQIDMHQSRRAER